ncbi:MAG: amino acid racemase [Cyclobacteriaceae bacterium]
MKSIGLIGGTSWHSTVEYYREINQLVNDHFGNNTNPPVLIYTLNQAAIHQYQIENKWDQVAQCFTGAGLSLQRAGVEAVMFCANTPHKVYDIVKENLDVPILHIADATANAIKSHQISKVGLIGTKFTMEEDFLVERFSQNGITALVPEESDVINELHRIIQKELTFGQIKPESKEFVLEAIQLMVNRGAQGIILGCTEFPLMISKKDFSIPVFDTTSIHAKAAVDFILDRS